MASLRYIPIAGDFLAAFGSSGEGTTFKLLTPSPAASVAKPSTVDTVNALDNKYLGLGAKPTPAALSAPSVAPADLSEDQRRVIAETTPAAPGDFGQQLAKLGPGSGLGGLLGSLGIVGADAAGQPALADAIVAAGPQGVSDSLTAWIKDAGGVAVAGLVVVALIWYGFRKTLKV